MGSKLLAFLLMTSAALGQAVCVTNRTHVGLPLGPLLNPITYMQRGDELRHNNYAFDGSGPVDLGASFVKYEIVSGPTMSISRTNVTYTATILGPGLTQVIITPNLPAGQYYTKFLAYQNSNSNFLRTLSWDTLIVTNPASASIGINMHVESWSGSSISAVTGRYGGLTVDGTMRVQDLDVEGTLLALDESKVLKEGETNVVDLTNTYVFARDPTSAAHVATMQWTTQKINEARSGSDGLIFLNEWGDPSWTNGTNVVSFEGAQPITGNVLNLTFDDPSDLTNFAFYNSGSWTANVSGSKLWVYSPPAGEAVDQTRWLAALATFNTNGPCSMTAKYYGNSLIHPNVNLQYGIGCSISASTGCRKLQFRLAVGLLTIRVYSQNITAPGTPLSTGGVTGLPADPIASFAGLTLDDWPVWLGWDYDGNNRWRGYVAEDTGHGAPARWLQISVVTNAAPSTYPGLAFSMPGANNYSTQAVICIDNVTFSAGPGSLLQ